MQFYEDNKRVELVNAKSGEVEYTGSLKECVKFIKAKRASKMYSIYSSLIQARDKSNRRAYGYLVRDDRRKSKRLLKL